MDAYYVKTNVKEKQELVKNLFSPSIEKSVTDFSFTNKQKNEKQKIVQALQLNVKWISILLKKRL